MPKKKKTRFAPDGTPLDKKTRKADDREKAKKAKAEAEKKKQEDLNNWRKLVVALGSNTLSRGLWFAAPITLESNQEALASPQKRG